MLEKVKLALRIASDDFDLEIRQYITDCLLELRDLKIVDNDSPEDEQITTAVIAYVKWHFGNNDSTEKWEQIYSTKVARLLHTTGYGVR